MYDHCWETWEKYSELGDESFVPSVADLIILYKFNPSVQDITVVDALEMPRCILSRGRDSYFHVRQMESWIEFLFPELANIHTLKGGGMW